MLNMFSCRHTHSPPGRERKACLGFGAVEIFVTHSREILLLQMLQMLQVGFLGLLGPSPSPSPSSSPLKNPQSSRLTFSNPFPSFNLPLSPVLTSSVSLPHPSRCLQSHEDS